MNMNERLISQFPQADKSVNGIDLGKALQALQGSQGNNLRIEAPPAPRLPLRPAPVSRKAANEEPLSAEPSLVDDVAIEAVRRYPRNSFIDFKRWPSTALKASEKTTLAANFPNTVFLDVEAEKVVQPPNGGPDSANPSKTKEQNP
jgi:hypothetical protein